MLKTWTLSRFHRTLIKVILDLSVFAAAFTGSYLMRFDLSEFAGQIARVGWAAPLFLALQLGSYVALRFYASLWRYAGAHDLVQILKGATLGSVAIAVTALALGLNLPRSILAADWMLIVFLGGGLRFAVRYLHSRDSRGAAPENHAVRALIYGAGKAGDLLLRSIEITRDPAIQVLGFIDDEPAKLGRTIRTKPVLGNRHRISALVEEHNIGEIYLSIPKLSGQETREILQFIKNQVGERVKIKTVPGLSDLVNGRVTVAQLRNFEIKDLLRRKPVKLDPVPVACLILGKSVLVAGGAGSIGMELCRQIAALNPKQLIIVDSSEYNLYRAEDEISRRFPGLKLVRLVADAGDEPFMRRVFSHYRPDLVFHAAAYKHVPLMEMNPWAAVGNNLSNTLVLSRLACQFNVDRFILISTDKAVHPTNVMGATKRICEQMIFSLRGENPTKFIAVRFGNVLGSSGSVIPKFKAQIERGSPITVTHPEITRYFMLISEAVELVLQAGAIGQSGNIYVLDMGEPIRIAEVAKYMIEMSGLRVNQDIKIVFTGLRPGEKLHESLFLEGEERATTVPSLLMLKPRRQIQSSYLRQVEGLLAGLDRMDHRELRAALQTLVPEYVPEPVTQELLPFAEPAENESKAVNLPVISERTSRPVQMEMKPAAVG